MSLPHPPRALLRSLLRLCVLHVCLQHHSAFSAKLSEFFFLNLLRLSHGMQVVFSTRTVNMTSYITADVLGESVEHGMEVLAPARPKWLRGSTWAHSSSRQQEAGQCRSRAQPHLATVPHDKLIR